MPSTIRTLTAAQMRAARRAGSRRGVNLPPSTLASVRGMRNSPFFVPVAVPPSHMNIRLVVNRLRQAVQTSGRRMMRLLNKTVENWEPEHKANATFRLSIRGTSKGSGQIGYFLTNRDVVWGLLDRGTDVNYYINVTEPRQDFSTRPGYFGSYAIPTQKYVWTGLAQAGIIPRGWRRKLQPIAEADLLNEIDRALDEIEKRFL